MGIFDRIRNGFRRKAEQTIEHLEQQNPEAVYTAAIETTKESATEHRAHAAAIVQRRNKTAERIEQMEREVLQVTAALGEALEEGDDDTALVLQMRKTEIEEQLELCRIELVELTEKAEEARQTMVQLKQGAAQLERERSRKLAQLAAVEATLSVQEANSGLADTPDARALGTVRESIERLESRAAVDREGNPSRTAVGKKASEQSALKQLEELKKKYKHTDEEDE